MANLNFDEVLNTKYGGDPQKVLGKYTYNKGDDIFKRIDGLSEFNSRELNNIINMIVLWKINRIVNIEDGALQQLQNIGSIESVNDDNIDDIKTLLEALLKSKGIRLPVASAILHFFNKDCFPIFDQRAYRVIYEGDYKESTSIKKKIDLYLNYIKKCYDYCNNHLNCAIQFSEIDKYLYLIDIAAGNKISY